IQHYQHNRLILAIIAMFIFQPVACSQKYLCIWQNNIVNVEKPTLDQANQEFQQGKYEQANVLYEQLYKQTDNDCIKLHALYGLACTRFVLAKNPIDLKNALSLWNEWTEITDDMEKNHDPDMLTPFLEKITQSSLEDGTFELEFDNLTPNASFQSQPMDLNSINTKPNIPRNPKIIKTDIKKKLADKEIEYQKRLQVKEKEIRELKNELGGMKMNIQLLQNQINALEVIHQEIQEKKKGLSVP
ncbi:MAG: hypothetical protein HQK77_18175, partial [Desulfobacterales bacterium]|nr:hypothetical protein [Desulfobacterales bacterium]